LKELKYWLALWRTPDIGPKRFFKLLALFPQLSALFTTPLSKLETLGLSSKALESLAKPNWPAVEQDLRWAEGKNCHIITWHDPHYPLLLKETTGAPPVLFIEGDIALLSSQQIAMVGSRNPTPTGTEIAWQFAKDLSLRGLTITSGLALGIDAASHRGALKGSGKTIAVLGSGLANIYPARHKNLAQEIIAANGAIISEFPPETVANASNFPRRNRLVSGLSLGVLVVEATLRSGSLITARLAAEQNRDVFAIPSSIYNPLARGCHALIRQGAKLVETTQDILEELQGLTSFSPAPSFSQTNSVEKKNLDADYQLLLECIGYETTTIDQMSERTGFTTAHTTAMALILELKGYIAAISGGGYAKCNFYKIPWADAQDIFP